MYNNMYIIDFNIERKRMKDLREDIGTTACIVGKMVKSPDEMD